MIGIIFSSFLALTLIMCFVRIRFGIAMYMFYSILVPFTQFLSFGKNFVPVVILIALFFNYGFKNLYYKPLVPFLFFFIAQLCIIPFHDDVSYGIQFNFLRSDFMSALLLPFAIVNVVNRDQKALKLFMKTMIAAITIAAGYSLFLVTIAGSNPYLLLIMPLNGSEFNDAYASTENAGRIFGRISGVFSHPMTNGLFLSLSAIYVFFQILDSSKPKEKMFFIALLVVVFLSIFFIGVRSAIAASALGLLLFILIERKFQLAFALLIGSIVLLLVISQIPGMGDFIYSIVDSKSSAVGGSSVAMRESQLNGALQEIEFNPLFGKGYGWTIQYKLTRGLHPVLLSFESLLYVVLCNNGIVGVIIWIVMLIAFLKRVRRTFESRYFALVAVLMTVYVSYSLITGEYGYMAYFLIFYALMWMYGLSKYRKLPRKYKNRVAFDNRLRKGYGNIPSKLTPSQNLT